MKERLRETSQSSTAITFVDALTLIRAVRAKGHQCMQYTPEFLDILDHPLLTNEARRVIERALGGELKVADRQRQRAERPLTSSSHGKTIRAKVGKILRVELKSKDGFYWEPAAPSTFVSIEVVIGSQAKPGHESFQCRTVAPGQMKIAWCLRPDARRRQPNMKSPSPEEIFQFELVIEA